MYSFFFICFGVGAGFVVLSFILGEALGMIDFDFDFDFSFDGVSPLKPQLLAVFLAVFGGTGMLLLNKVQLWITLPFAVFLGLTVAFLIFRFVYVPLHKMQATAVEMQSLIGHTATIVEKIPQGYYGKITYYVDGNTYSAPAKSEDGGEISRNETVEIVYIEKNTYYVRKKI